MLAAYLLPARRRTCAGLGIHGCEPQQWNPCSSIVSNDTHRNHGYPDGNVDCERHSRVYATVNTLTRSGAAVRPEKTIESDSPGSISGGFQLDPTSECPVVVRITLTVPSGMHVSGASGTFSTGAGMTTAQFTVNPNAGSKTFR